MTRIPRHHRPSPRRSARAAGFTLVELLTAIFVFTLGLTAIASLFPIAAFVQRQAYDQTVGLQTGRTLNALVFSRQFDLDELRGASTGVLPFRPDYLQDGGEWPLRLRAFPQADDVPLQDRDFFAVPLGQDPVSVSTGDERLFIFLLVRQGKAEYVPGDNRIPPPDERANQADNTNIQFDNPDLDLDPIPQVVRYDLSADPEEDEDRAPAGDDNVLEPELGEVFFEVDRSIADMLSPGDPILINTGQILTVRETEGETVYLNSEFEADVTEIDAFWYAPPPDLTRASPTLQILTFGPEAFQ